MKKNIIIAIDGPAGAGKSTIARQLSNILGYTYVDSGAMYRALTLKIIKDNIDLSDTPCIIEAARNAKIDFIKNSIYLDNEEVNAQIREDIINLNVSRISAIPEVRKILVDLQRKISTGTNIVMDGRDVGTVIFPDADIKLFITASVEERTTRRFNENKAKNNSANWEEIKVSIINRDKIDSNRETSPLRMADDAILIDTTNKTVNEILDFIIPIVKSKERE